MQSIYLYSLSGLSLVLGFIALLKQRTYIDADTKQPTEIEVPIFGKLKSNYPALVFVFLGFATSIFAYDRSDKYNREQLNLDLGKETWTISGKFYPVLDTTCGDRKIDYERGIMFVEPTEIIVGPDIDPDGHFEFKINIPKDKQFEEAITSLSFTLDNGEAQMINTMEQFDSYKRNETCMLTNAINRVRVYRVPVKCY